MKNLALVSILFATLGLSNITHAEQQTFSIGYAQSKVQDFKNIRGVNLKYRYEWDSQLGIIGSFTYMSGKENSTSMAYRDIINNHIDLKYYSFAAGPTYRFNEYISAYGLLGLNYNKLDYRTKWNNYEGDRGYIDKGEESGKQNKASLMYGIGLQINPVEYLAIDIGYEGSRLNAGDKNHSINGFNIGLGYSF